MKKLLSIALLFLPILGFTQTLKSKINTNIRHSSYSPAGTASVLDAVVDTLHAGGGGGGGTWGSIIGSLSSQTDLNTALNSKLVKANNLSDLVTPSTARTNLGASVVGSNIFTLGNPSAITWLRVNADNSISARSASQTLSDIGAQAAGSYLIPGNNLSDVGSVSTTRQNLGGSTIGINLFTATNPSAVRWIRVNSDNSVSFRTAAETLTDIGAGSSSYTADESTLHLTGTVFSVKSAGLGATQMASSFLDVDGSLSANSDIRVPSQRAIVTYTAAQLSAAALPAFDATHDGYVANAGVGYKFLLSDGLWLTPGTTGQTIIGGGATTKPTWGLLTTTGTLTSGGTGAGFTIALGSSTVTGRLAYSNLAQGSALSVSGVTGNATADIASIVAGSDKQVLRRSGTAVGFGSIDLSASAAVGSSLLGPTNGGLGNNLTPTNGALVVGNSGAYTNYTVGAEGQMLVVAGGFPLWSEKDPVMNHVTTPTPYTAVLTDDHKKVFMDFTTTNTFLVPLQSSVAWVAKDATHGGSLMYVVNMGTGQTTIGGVSGVTINSPANAYKLSYQWSQAVLEYLGSNQWLLTGNVTP